MEIFQGSSRGLIWKQQIRGPTMMRRRARPHGRTTGCLKKSKKPKEEPWAGATESVISTGRPAGVTTWTRTFPGAPKSTLFLALSKSRGLTSPFSTHITTNQEKISCPKTASGASRAGIGRRRAAWMRITMITYSLLSRGKKSLNCETASDLSLQCLSGPHVYDILAIFSLTMSKASVVGFWFFNLSHT